MRRLLLVCLAALAAACGSPSATPQPNHAIWTLPPDWVTVSGNSGVQLTLPPYIVAFDLENAIFANEAPPPGETDIPIQVWAQGPNVDDQPRNGESLSAWIERRLDNPAKGIATVTPVSFPAGSGIRYDRVDRDASGWAWRIVVFALQRPDGVTWLMIDGPPDEWAARAADLERIPLLFRVLIG
jgi:hypothetical protein